MVTHKTALPCLSDKEIEKGLNELVNSGHLNRFKKEGKTYWQDSDEVTRLLKNGWTREEIDRELKLRLEGKKKLFSRSRPNSAISKRRYKARLNLKREVEGRKHAEEVKDD